MDTRWLGLIELGVVLLCLVGWGILELVCRRLDRKREIEKRQLANDVDSRDADSGSTGLGP
jgi:hypothetical protein